MVKEKVVILKCEEYNEKIYEKLKNGIQSAGINTEISEKILFKPNMLSARNPDEGVTTHPLILKYLSKIFSKSEIYCGDSPANTSRPIENYWEKCGYTELAENGNFKLVKFDKSFFIEIEVADKKVKIPVSEYVLTHKIINIPKLKTHNLTLLTCAIKNLYGLIPGFKKGILHSEFISPVEFSEFLVEFYRKVEKYIFFNVVDAIISMEGNGPSAGDLRKSGYLIIGKNAVAVDIICARLIGIDEMKIPFLKIYSDKYGLPEIEILGDKFTPLKNFKTPSSFRISLFQNKLLSPFLKFLGKNFKIIPVINKEKCRKCYACIEVCPVKAISENLKIDRKKCINCLCCFEVCPYRAIEIKKSFIAQIFT